MNGEVSLRRVRPEDAYALWIWANDPQTRAASHGRPPIPWEGHRAWLSERIGSPDHLILVGMASGELPVGSVRFDTADGWQSARLSYVVAPEARGRGFGRALVEQGTALVRAEHPGVRLLAEVLEVNVASARAFRGLGWREVPREAGSLQFVFL